MKTHIVNAITGENIIRDLTTEEQKKAELEKQNWENNAFNRSISKLRNKRNSLLADSDWTDLPNSPLTDEKKSEWQTYRTNLRDITDGLTTVEQVEAVEFPSKP
tara:strand:+ start:361 stop:672 length:312 start_codon:yes stop_codon:yes gene_type:complete